MSKYKTGDKFKDKQGMVPGLYTLSYNSTWFNPFILTSSKGYWCAMQDEAHLEMHWELIAMSSILPPGTIKIGARNGTVFTVTSFDYDLDSYNCIADNGQYTYTALIHKASLDNHNLYKDPDNLSTPNPAEPSCTCDTRDLFNKGCQCGFIKPYKPLY